MIFGGPLGVDLGQAVDYTAFCGLKREVVGTRHPNRGVAGVPEGREAALYTIVGLERERGVSYVEIADMIEHFSSLSDLATPKRRIAGSRARPTSPITVPPVTALDYGGPGRPAADILDARGFSHMKVTITGTGEPTVTAVGASIKRFDLLNLLLAAFHNQWLKVAGGLELRDALTEELLNLKPKPTPSGGETIGLKTEAIHDDLVISVALALFAGHRLRRRRRMLRGAFGRRGPL